MNDKLEESQWYRDSEELGKKFFDRWSILSGGTLTLLIPFIQSLNGQIRFVKLLIVIEFLLVISLLTSSIHSWIASQISFYNTYSELDREDHKKQNFYVFVQKINHRIAIITYPIAIILLLIFINYNIF